MSKFLGYCTMKTHETIGPQYTIITMWLRELHSTSLILRDYSEFLRTRETTKPMSTPQAWNHLLRCTTLITYSMLIRLNLRSTGCRDQTTTDLRCGILCRIEDTRLCAARSQTLINFVYSTADLGTNGGFSVMPFKKLKNQTN